MSDSNNYSDETRTFTHLAPGMIIDHYVLESIIGIGGMGEVYLAWDQKLNRKVALKFLLPIYFSDEGTKDRILREARAIASLNHPNIVIVYDVGEFEGRPFISMEYAEGPSLAKVAKDPSLDLNKKLDYALQICEGLKAAHDLEIIHRDLKPSNIKTDKSGRIKLLDFGLAKNLRTDTVDKKGQIEGTLQYMSPEQISGLPLSPATDIFSLGVVLYEFFVGKLPFFGDNSADLIYSVLHESPPSPHDSNPEFPDWIDDLLLKLLAKNPDDRFSDAQQIIDYIMAYRTNAYAALDLGPIKKRRKSIAMMALRNLSGDQSWDYFCVGFTDDLIREISRRTDLIVAPEPEGTGEQSLDQIFKRSRSDYVISGNLMKWKDMVRLGLSIYGDKGCTLIYGENFEGHVDNIFTLLSQAALNISRALSDASGSLSTDVDRPLQGDIGAYDYYLKGRNYYHTNKPEEIGFAEKMFRKALEIDPNFALAHAGLSDLFTTQYMSFYDRTPEKLRMAKIEAELALQMDDQLPEAHRSLGRYYMFAGELEAAEKAFLKAVGILPKYAIGYRTLAWLKDMRGEDEEALVWAKKALELAPTDLETLLLISLLYLDMNKFTLALSALQRAVEIGPDYGRAFYLLGSVYLKLGVLDLSLEYYGKAMKYEGDPNSYIDAGYVHLVQGNFSKAKSLFLLSIEKGYLDFMAYYYLGLTAIIEKNKKTALEYFEKSIYCTDEFIRRESGNLCILSYKALSQAWMGKSKLALGIIEGLQDSCKREGETLYNISRCYAVLKDRGKSEEYKNRALEGHGGPSKKEIELDPHFKLSLK